jgi:hypothetical protein
MKTLNGTIKLSKHTRVTFNGDGITITTVHKGEEKHRGLTRDEARDRVGEVKAKQVKADGLLKVGEDYVRVKAFIEAI